MQNCLHDAAFCQVMQPGHATFVLCQILMSLIYLFSWLLVSVVTSSCWHARAADVWFMHCCFVLICRPGTSCILSSYTQVCGMWGVLGPAAAGGLGGHQWHEAAAGVKASERIAHIQGCLADGPHNGDWLAAEAAEAAAQGVQCRLFPALVCLQPGGACGQAVTVAVTESCLVTSDPLTARVCMALSKHNHDYAAWLEAHYVMVLATRQPSFC